MAEFHKKPLVDGNLVTEFGYTEESLQGMDEARNDYTFVPGFSGLREKRDLDLARLAAGEIKGHEVSVLPVNCRWFRTVKGSGSDLDQMRVAHARNIGYRPVTKADIGKPWLTAMPPGGMEMADGTIRSAAGDLALFVADQVVAARNAMRKKMRTEELVDGMQFKAGGLGEVGKKHKADPIVTKEVVK